jgi:TonB-linked SusC/RagA family outer membrane protein
MSTTLKNGFFRNRLWFRASFLVFMLLLFNSQVFAQKTVNGRVTTDAGVALAKATVQIKGKPNAATVTDESGNFSINALPTDLLVVSYIGFKTIEVPVGNGDDILVSLTKEVSQLEEAVVIGYGTVKKRDLTGSVSRLSTKDFKDQPVTRLDQVLQGRVAGVEVTNVSGIPGGDVKIRIRGSNSILGDNNPLYVIDGFVGADFTTINPDDIASIEVLKDASSTAIYGSRGANGVILITTRRGNASKPEITLGYTYFSSEPSKKYDLLKASEFAETVNTRNQVFGLAPTFTQAQIDQFRASGGTDWQDEIFRTAPGHEYKLSIAGGNAKTSYLFSGDYLDQKGVVVNSDYKRYALRTNLSSQIKDNLSMRLNLAAYRRESLNSNIQGKSSPITQSLAWAPTTPVRNASGNYTKNDPVGSIFENPVALAYDQTNKLEITGATLIGGVNYKFFKDLSLDVSFGADYQNNQGKFYFGRYVGTAPNAARSSAEVSNLQNTNNLTYSHIFNNVHSLTVTAVFEQQKYVTTGFNANASNLTFPSLGFNNLSLSATQSAGTVYSKSNIQSLLGRVNYVFNNKYLLTASIRRDGSSKFQPSNRYSTFPSVALGWKLSEESFIKEMNVFDELKLRASYGKTGSQAIAPYATLSTYLTDIYNAGAPFNSTSITSGIVIGNASNSDLKWETTTASDIGLDMSLFKNRLNITVDGYIKNTEDLLVAVPLPAYIGGGNIISNVGKIKNKGLEVSIDATPIQSRNFRWTSIFNMAFQNNEVTDIGKLTKIFSSGYKVGSGLAPQPEFVIMPGHALGSYWGLRYLGTWKPNEATEAALYGAKPGDSRYQDVNGDKAINVNDYQIMGNGLPTKFLGWNNTLTYKAFELNIFFQSALNFDKLNYAYASSVTPNADARQSTHVDIRNRYIPGKNESSNIPAFSQTNKDFFQSSRFLQKGDFVRLKNLSLSYDISNLKGIKIKVFAGVTNLFTITDYKGYDPESSNAGSGSDISQSVDYGSYPNSRTYFFGTTIKL